MKRSVPGFAANVESHTKWQMRVNSSSNQQSEKELRRPIRYCTDDSNSEIEFLFEFRQIFIQTQREPFRKNENISMHASRIRIPMSSPAVVGASFMMNTVLVLSSAVS